jgi:hypothetical protein
MTNVSACATANGGITHHMTTRRKVTLVLFVILVLPLAAFLGYGFVYVPLKFHYLVSRVESAKTAAEEHRAFQLAADWGRVWEVDRLSPNDMAANGRQITGDWLLRLEWLESSLYSGRAYVAYRAVIDTNNLRVLARSR